METEKKIWIFSFVLVIIGAINWGLIGLFDFDLVAYIFGIGSKLSHVVYTLVGIAALYLCFKSGHVYRTAAHPID